MSRPASAGLAAVAGIAAAAVVLAAVALWAPLFTCPRCEGRAAIVRDCQLNAGRTPAFEACGTCRDRGAVTPLRRLRLRSARP